MTTKKKTPTPKADPGRPNELGDDVRVFRFKLGAAERAALEKTAKRIGITDSELARRAVRVFCSLPDSVQRGAGGAS